MDTWFPTFRRLAGLRLTDSPWPFWPLYTTRSQRRSLLRLIASGTEAHLPLAPLLEAWADDERGVQKGRVRRLAGSLGEGVPLPEAVEQTPGVLRDEDILAIRFGAQSGALARTLRDSLKEADATPVTGDARYGKTKGYFIALAAVALVIIAFLEIKITPALVKIYQDFNMQLPEALRWSIELTDVVVQYWPLFALAFVSLTWALFSVRGSRFLRGSFIGRLFGGTRELLASDILQKLSVATRAGRPVTGALSTLARYHFDPEMRHKLLYIRNEVEQGADVWKSMTAAGLLDARESAVMTTAERVGNRPWALHQLAAVKDRRTWRRRRRIAQWLHPAIILIAGGFVLLYALAMFTTLTHLVYGLV